jgi:hypothetical protein
MRSVSLDYSSDRKKWGCGSRRLWSYLLIVASIATFIACNRQRLTVVFLQYRCRSSPFSDSDAVFNMDRDADLGNSPGPRWVPVQLTSRGWNVVHSDWAQLLREVGASEAEQSILVGTLCTPSGKERVIGLRVAVASYDAKTVVLLFSFDSVVPGTLLSDPSVAFRDRAVVGLEQYAFVDAPVKLLSPRKDPSSPSKFFMPYRSSTKSGQIVGTLGEDGMVKLEEHSTRP